MLNEELAKKQKITQEQRNNLETLYKTLEFVLTSKYETVDERLKAVEDVKNIEFLLQDNWNFDRDELKHTWWNMFPECTCPRNDNIERFGFEKIINMNCPFHGKNIKRIIL